MRKKEINNLKIGLLFTIALFSLMSISISYSHWEENLGLHTNIATGLWDTHLKISKTLEGSFTDPNTGEDLIGMITDSIAIGANFSSKFELRIFVENGELTELKNVIVTDRIDKILTPIQTNPDKGTVTWDSNFLTWVIPNIEPEELVCLVIDVQTIYNYDFGGYEPICEGENYLIPIRPTDGSVYNGISKNYNVETPVDNHFKSIKYETINRDGILNGEYDIFEFTVNQDSDEYPIDIQVMADELICFVELSYNGMDSSLCGSSNDFSSTPVIANGFEFELLSKIDNCDRTYTYQFKITNNNDVGLTNVTIALPPSDYCQIRLNTGANVYAEAGDSVWSETPLRTNTDAIVIGICCIDDNIGNIIQTLPYITDWAEDSYTN